MLCCLCGRITSCSRVAALPPTQERSRYFITCAIVQFFGAFLGLTCASTFLDDKKTKGIVNCVITSVERRLMLHSNGAKHCEQSSWGAFYFWLFKLLVCLEANSCSNRCGHFWLAGFTLTWLGALDSYAFRSLPASDHPPAAGNECAVARFRGCGSGIHQVRLLSAWLGIVSISTCPRCC